MTDPELELEVERRLETKADRADVDRLVARIEATERWQSAQDALTAIRRWSAPVLVTVFTTALNIGISLAHKS